MKNAIILIPLLLLASCTTNSPTLQEEMDRLGIRFSLLEDTALSDLQRLETKVDAIADVDSYLHSRQEAHKEAMKSLVNVGVEILDILEPLMSDMKKVKSKLGIQDQTSFCFSICLIFRKR